MDGGWFVRVEKNVRIVWIERRGIRRWGIRKKGYGKMEILIEKWKRKRKEGRGEDNRDRRSLEVKGKKYWWIWYWKWFEIEK